MKNFFNKVKAFFKAPIFANNEEKTRRARLLHVVLVAQTYVLLLSMAGTVVSALNNGQVATFELTVMATGLISIVFWRFLMSRGMVSAPSIGMLIFFVLSISMILFSGGTIRSSGLIFFPAVVVMATLLVNRRTGIIFFALVSLIGLFLIQGEINGILPTPDNSTGTSSIVLIVAGMGLTLVLMYLATQGMDEALKRANEKEQEVREFASTLEKRVEERTRALATSAEVSRRLASILDPGQLASAVVNEVQTASSYYYAQIYLFDEAGVNLVLTAGTGDAGAEMMKRGHSLPKGRGLVGRAAENKESILVSDTSQDPDWLPNELLPDTKTEAVVPIIIGDKVFGVLDVQHNVTNGLSQQDADLLQSVGNQVAVALQNARQYTEAQALLNELGDTQSFLDSVVENLPTMLFVKNADDLRFLRWNKAAEELSGFKREDLIGKNDYDLFPKEEADFFTSIDRQVLANGQLLDIHEEPIATAYQGVRYLHTRKVPIFSADGNVKYLLGVSEDITERKRNEEMTRQRARQQEAINLITQKIHSATTIEEAMQVAARELGHAVGNRQTSVELEAPKTGVAK